MRTVSRSASGSTSSMYSRSRSTSTPWRARTDRRGADRTSMSLSKRIWISGMEALLVSERCVWGEAPTLPACGACERSLRWRHSRRHLVIIRERHARCHPRAPVSAGSSHARHGSALIRHERHTAHRGSIRRIRGSAERIGGRTAPQATRRAFRRASRADRGAGRASVRPRPIINAAVERLPSFQALCFSAEAMHCASRHPLLVARPELPSPPGPFLPAFAPAPCPSPSPGDFLPAFYLTVTYEGANSQNSHGAHIRSPTAFAIL